MRPGIDVLRVLPLFATLDEAQLNALNEAGDFARVGPNENLFMENVLPNEVMILLSGHVAATHIDRNGNVAFTDVIDPVTAIGFAAALLGRPSPIGARTITSVRLIMIPAAELQRMIDNDLRLARQFLDHALNEMHALTIECQQLKLRPSAQRLARYLAVLAEGIELDPARFTLPFEKRFLAGKIGCSQETLSRAFAQLRALGVRTTARGAVIIQDIGKLRAYAELAPSGMS